MPPANSSPSDTPTFSSSLSDRLQDLSAPELIDMANSLIAEDDANDANVRFLRLTSALSPESDSDMPHASAQRRRLRQTDDFIAEQRLTQSQRESERRLRRAMLRNATSMPAEHGGLEPDSLLIFQDPARRRQGTLGYQGWAPGTEEEQQMSFEEMRALARGHTRPDPDTPTRRHMREQELALARSRQARRTADAGDMDWHTSRFADRAGDVDPVTTESSLRTTALLDSVRRQTRISEVIAPSAFPSATLANPDRVSRFQEERERATVNRLRNASNLHRRDNLDELRRGISYNLHRVRARDEHGPAASHWLEEAIKYLERLRFCGSDSERLSFAKAGGFVDGNSFACRDRDDFILDTSSIAPPHKSSWLRAGAIFSGSQQSTASPSGGSGLTIPNIHYSSTARRGQITSNIGSASASASASRPSAASTSPQTRTWMNSVIAHSSLDSADDSWPVKVTINSIDHDSMTLTGTMEAFNVPNKNSPLQKSTIATYLEGEIIDFNQYTLETKSFDASPRVDSTYWRELEPLKGLTDREVVHSLVSRKWLDEELGGKYILMRWKEKCFITPLDAQAHLTISGFYYVSLRRRDGHVEGLYFDPSSSPYQHLTLGPSARDFPSYQFR